MGNCQKQQQSNDQPNPDNDHQGPVSQIRLINYIWNQDYQGLFDYDTKQVNKKLLKIQGNAILLKSQDKYQLIDDKIQDLNLQQLKTCQFRLIQKQNFYQIKPIIVQSQNSNCIPKLLWAVISSLPNKVHKINEKDILKLGKQKIRVRQIVHIDSNPSNINQGTKFAKTVYENLAFQPNFDKQSLPHKQKQKQKEKELKGSMSDITNTEQVCRICLDPGEYDNPLITPCKCLGSVKYIHYNCLRAWLAKRLNTQKTQHCITINWLTLSCQMCKAPFNYRIYMDNKKFYTVDIPKPPRPYITIQLMRKTANSHGKIFHFVSFAQKNKIILGRRKDIDVRISDDISISRAHSTIQYFPDRKQFEISDNKSKFGTLLLLKKGLVVRPSFKNISFQIGAEIYSFEAIRGPSKPNFQKQEGQQDEYLVDDLSDDEDEIEDNQDEDEINSQENAGPESPTNHQIINISGHRLSADVDHV